MSLVSLSHIGEDDWQIEYTYAHYLSFVKWQQLEILVRSMAVNELSFVYVDIVNKMYVWNISMSIKAR